MKELPRPHPTPRLLSVQGQLELRNQGGVAAARTALGVVGLGQGSQGLGIFPRGVHHPGVAAVPFVWGGGPGCDMGCARRLTCCLVDALGP